MSDNPVKATSSVSEIAAVLAVHSNGGCGVVGQSDDGRAISGWSVSNYGVTGDSQTFPGMRGTSVSGRGVEGWSTSGEGVWATSTTGTAIIGSTPGAGTGVVGLSTTGDGVSGTGNRGVVGSSTTSAGVYGQNTAPHCPGVLGVNDAGQGVTGRSAQTTGVMGLSTSGVGIHGIAPLAGFFEGGVRINGELYIQGNIRLPQGYDIILEGAADCAEHFDIAGEAEVPTGTVLVIGKEGNLEESFKPYDRRVAGVVSGAGDFRPGIILDKRPSTKRRQPIALMGKVFCRVDADLGAIEVGDLLTTSSTSGHAMKAADHSLAVGALLGKALCALPQGRGLIPVLVALQ